MIAKRAFTGRARRRRVFGRLAVLAALCFGAWAIGLFWFAAMLPTAVENAERATDAIVVLTGGSGRVHQGLELLAEGRAEKLFVSGVYRGVDVEELLRVSRQSPEELACCIALGYLADNTRGNAIETAAWMAEEGLSSLRLVTAVYHMPRSLLEFRRAMPGLDIVPHPVFPEPFRQGAWWRWRGSASLVVSEYTKYLIALVRGLFDEPT